MADRENPVYQAKLAEQAERYDGRFLNQIAITAERLAPLQCPCAGGSETQVK